MPIANDLPMIEASSSRCRTPAIRTACAASARCRSCRRSPRCERAVSNALGVRFNRLPITPRDLLEELVKD